MSALEDRVAALEERLDQLAPPTDSLQASYLTVNPDGTIGADFTGHVHAEGLDLDAGTITSPPSQNRVRWIRTSDGALIADLAAYSTGVVGGLALSAYAPAPEPNSRADLQAIDNAGHLQAAFTAVQRNSGAQAWGQVQAGTNLLTIFNQAGQSGFPELPGSSVLRTQVLWGSFVAGATAPTGTPSGGFTVTKLAVGQYQIAWSQAFADQGYAVTPAASSGYCDVLTGSRTVGTIDIELRNFADVLTDLNWNFIAAGVY